jgi:hypothetical protein
MGDRTRLPHRLNRGAHRSKRGRAGVCRVCARARLSVCVCVCVCVADDPKVTPGRSLSLANTGKRPEDLSECTPWCGEPGADSGGSFPHDGNAGPRKQMTVMWMWRSSKYHLSPSPLLPIF